jgi:flagellar biosynthesis protein FlhA
MISEYVRQQIRRQIIAPYLNPKGELTAYFTDRALEQVLESAVEHGESTSVLVLSPQKAREIVGHLQSRIDPDDPVILVTAPGVRYFLRQMTEVSHPNLVVLSHNEIPPDVTVVSMGILQQ